MAVPTPTAPASVQAEFVRCRVLRHSWEVKGETEASGSKLIVLLCTSCGTHRYDRWNTRTGERWGNPGYIYPPGYQDRGSGRDADWWRKTFAEHLYRAGVIQKPGADTLPKAKKRA